MKDKLSKQSIYYRNITSLLIIRKNQKAFHPNASRKTLNLGTKLFGIKRVSLDQKQTIICISNLTSKIQNSRLGNKYKTWKNLINPQKKDFLRLQPFETIWLSNIY